MEVTYLKTLKIKIFFLQDFIAGKKMNSLLNITKSGDNSASRIENSIFFIEKKLSAAEQTTLN